MCITTKGHGFSPLVADLAPTGSAALLVVEYDMVIPDAANQHGSFGPEQCGTRTASPKASPSGFDDWLVAE